MILQSLCDLYRRSDLSEQLPYGFEKKVIPFVVVIDSNSRFVGINDTRKMIGKRAVGQSFLVPQAAKRSSGISANLLWDVSEYALVVDCKNNPERTQKQFEAFIERLEPYIDLAEVKCVYDFLTDLDHVSLSESGVWKDLVEDNALVSFQLEGSDKLVCQSSAFMELYSEILDKDVGDSESPCLVTGNIDHTAILHPAIKNVSGAQSTGSNIVSFNSSSFTSWSKKQGFNAPVSNRAAFEYTAALNDLTSPDSDRSFRIGSRTFVFWADEAGEIEDYFKTFFARDSNDEDKQVDQSYEKLLVLKKHKANASFHILGLAPNNARLSVCLWHKFNTGVLLTNLHQWFEDLLIIGVDRFGRPTLEQLLVSTSLQYKSKFLSDRMITDVMVSMLTGQPLPHMVHTELLNRIRVDNGKVNYTRASFLKAFLNRKYRSEDKHDMVMQIVLDEENSQSGYVLGRLFAVFERLQIEAHRSNLSSTITSRYYGGASVRPQSVFNALFKLHIHHIRKLRNPGRVVNFRKMIGELMQKIEEIPAFLSIEQQSLFAVGYYHQRQSFYTSNNEADADEDGADEFE